MSPSLFTLTAAAPRAGIEAVSTPRRGPELSDAALFVAAAIAVWLTRRALRNRGRRG